MTNKRNDGNVAAKDQARTPPEIFWKLDEEFNFDVDAAAEQQQEIQPIDAAVVAELNALIATTPKCKKFSELAGKISKLSAKDKEKLGLLEPAMQLNQQGKLKF